MLDFQLCLNWRTKSFLLRKTDLEFLSHNFENKVFCTSKIYSKNQNEETPIIT